MSNTIVVHKKDSTIVKFDDCRIKYETSFVIIIDRYGNTTTYPIAEIAFIKDNDTSRQPRYY